MNICFFEKCCLNFQWFSYIFKLSTYLLNNKPKSVHFFFTKKTVTSKIYIFFIKKSFLLLSKNIAPIQYLKLTFVKIFSHIILFFNSNIKNSLFLSFKKTISFSFKQRNFLNCLNKLMKGTFFM